MKLVVRENTKPADIAFPNHEFFYGATVIIFALSWVNNGTMVIRARATQMYIIGSQ